MKPEDHEESAARTVNLRAAGHYDAMPYVPDPEPLLDLDRAFGLATAYGFAEPAQPSVLDLGCGVGVQLERIAAQTSGEIVGADISPTACTDARTRLSAQGGRVRILEADLLDLDPDELGQFDAVYAVGILFVVPAVVQQRLFDLIGRCLKPGGVAVLSYYAGSMGALRPPLNRLIRGAVDAKAPPPEQVRQVRGLLRDLGEQLRQTGPSLPAQLVQILASYNNDATLFHEVLGEDLTPTGTGEIEAALSGRGLEFLSYLHPMPYCGLPASAQRAHGADLFDFLYGGYRYAAFVKGAAGAPAASRVPRWQSGLRRRDGPTGYGMPVEYHHPALGAIRVAAAPVQAALDQLSQGPMTRDDLFATARSALRIHGVDSPANLETILDGEFQKLWQAGWLTPLGQARPPR